MGCKADVLDVVYGIVTNYVEWVFLKYTGDTVSEERFSVATTTEGPDMKGIKIIAWKLYVIYYATIT